MKITLPGSETVTLTGQTIDKLIRAGDGDAALLYLYILKTHGHKTSSEAAVALQKNKGWVASAMAVLSRLGLVQLDDYDGTAEAEMGVSTSGNDSEKSAGKPFEQPRKHTQQEVTNELMSGSDFSVVVDETQRRLGTILSPDDLLRLFGIYDHLRLPPEVILQLITHCIKECSITGDGRAPSVRYIEKAAYTWEREGIYSLERAEEYLKALEAKKSARGQMKNTLHIKDRELSATEKRYVDSWIEMGFKSDAIAIAYDRTVVKTGGMAWPYIDGILKNWHNKGLHTAEQINENDSGKQRKTAGKQSSGQGYGRNSYGSQKHGEPTNEEMERMQRLLNKIKEE
ncbi:MAG: DnaD domain protein [Oscillospiraceae bacterium]|nr:DnaD domain protein [Oscillospiraceae bacterium]